MTSIFISRPLDANSVLNSLFEKEEVSWTDRSLISFKEIPFALPQTKWLFFYSRKGVYYFKKGLKDGLDTSSFLFAAYGPGTAAEIENQLGSPVSFLGNSDPKYCHQQMSMKAEPLEVTFVRGMNSLRSIQTKFQSWDISPECIVYDNIPMTDVTLGEYQIAIFTSPMNVRAFFANGGKAHEYLVIGKSTFREIELMKTGSPVVISKEPSEESLADALRQMIV